MMQKLPGFTGHLIAYCRILCILKYYRIIFQNQQLTTAMIRSGYILIIFLFSKALFLQVIGQLPSYHVQFFDETTGIRSGNFQNIDMIKDQDNFLWILQTTTVQRFDGKRVDDYSFSEARVLEQRVSWSQVEWDPAALLLLVCQPVVFTQCWAPFTL